MPTPMRFASSPGSARALAQLRARSWPQMVCLSLLILNGGLAWACLSTGHPSLGTTLTVIDIISIVLFLIWMRTTRLPR